MAWKPLLERLNGNAENLPLVLAGPILRKVTKDSVTVWFVLSKQQNTKMHIWWNNKNVVPLTTHETYVKVGDHVHIYTVTAKLEESLRDTSNYHYDISFNNGTNNLVSELYKKELDFSYDGTNRPSFSLPQKMSHLNIVHGSCRKPHAEGRDAMEGLEKMMERKLNDGSYARWFNPQLLFLTGDQIYADDVADAMLYMIRDAAKVLFGWEEEFGETVEMRVGRREQNNGKVGLTSGESKNHLLTFQEYCVMYIMVWSDVLWQDDGALPTYHNIYPKKINAKINKDFYRWGGRVGDDTSEPILPIKNLKSDFDDEIINLKTFRETLLPIRKALANIPTYMIFDDHDVTDDWNLNWQWCKEIYSKTLGLQLLRNALTAYTLFQGVGNTPEQFENGNGKSFLEEIHNIRTRPSSALDAYLNISPIIIDAVHQEERSSLPHSLDWHYQLSFDEIEIIVLDTRTMRAYPKEHPIGYCGLISKTGFDIQLPKENTIEDKLVFVVSPSPLIETNIMQFIKTINPGKSGSTGRTFWDSEGWSLNDTTYQRLLARLSLLKKSKDNLRNDQFIILSGDIHHGYTAKLELWANRLFEESVNNKIKTHNTFIQFTSSPLKNEDRITRLLHNIGYTIPSPISTETNSDESKKFALVVGAINLVSSLQNPLPSPEDTFCWNGEKDKELSIGRSTWGDDSLDPRPKPFSWHGNPVVFSRKDAQNFDLVSMIEPEWVSQKSYLLGDGTYNIKNINVRRPNPKKINTPDEVVYEEMNSDFKKYVKQWGNGKEIVGENNIGQITFVGIEDTYKAVQDLWWHIGNEDESSLEIYPLTEFELKLNDESPKPTFK